MHVQAVCESVRPQPDPCWLALEGWGATAQSAGVTNADVTVQGRAGGAGC